MCADNITSSAATLTCSSADAGCVDLDDLYHFESVVRVAVPSIFSLIGVVGLVGNMLVVTVVVADGRRLMHGTTNVLITSLAVADLLFIVVCVPFTAAGYALPVWPFGDAWCKVSSVC